MSTGGYRPDAPADTVCYLLIGDPEGDAQDVHRFPMRQDASSENPDQASVGSFELDLNVFFGDFLCAKESYSRTSAKKIKALTAHHESPTSGGSELDLNVFLTHASSARPSGRLRRSRRKRRSGDFLFKKKDTRAPARKRFQALPARCNSPTSVAAQNCP